MKEKIKYLIHALFICYITSCSILGVAFISVVIGDKIYKAIVGG